MDKIRKYINNKLLDEKLILIKLLIEFSLINSKYLKKNYDIYGKSQLLYSCCSIYMVYLFAHKSHMLNYRNYILNMFFDTNIKYDKNFVVNVKNDLCSKIHEKNISCEYSCYIYLRKQIIKFTKFFTILLLIRIIIQYRLNTIKVINKNKYIYTIDILRSSIFLSSFLALIRIFMCYFTKYDKNFDNIKIIPIIFISSLTFQLEVESRKKILNMLVLCYTLNIMTSEMLLPEKNKIYRLLIIMLVGYFLYIKNYKSLLKLIIL